MSTRSIGSTESCIVRCFDYDHDLDSYQVYAHDAHGSMFTWMDLRGQLRWVEWSGTNAKKLVVLERTLSVAWRSESSYAYRGTKLRGWNSRASKPMARWSAPRTRSARPGKSRP